MGAGTMKNSLSLALQQSTRILTSSYFLSASSARNLASFSWFSRASILSSSDRERFSRTFLILKKSGKFKKGNFFFQFCIIFLKHGHNTDLGETGRAEPGQNSLDFLSSVSNIQTERVLGGENQNIHSGSDRIQARPGHHLHECFVREEVVGGRWETVRDHLTPPVSHE